MLPFDLSLPDLSRKQYDGQNIPTMDFGFLLLLFFPKAYHCFGRRQASSLNMYVCAGIGLIGKFNG